MYTYSRSTFIQSMDIPSATHNLPLVYIRENVPDACRAHTRLLARRPHKSSWEFEKYVCILTSRIYNLAHVWTVYVFVDVCGMCAVCAALGLRTSRWRGRLHIWGYDEVNFAITSANNYLFRSRLETSSGEYNF